MSKGIDTSPLCRNPAKSIVGGHHVGVSGLNINKYTKGLFSLLYQWNSTTYTFFTGRQEVSPTLEDFYEILRLPLFGEGDVVNIPLTSVETKIVKFLEDAMKKTLKKPIRKDTRKRKAPCEEVLEDTSVGGDKGSRANFMDQVLLEGACG